MPFVEQLHRARLKVTGPRLKVLQAFEDHAEQHLGVEDVHKSMQTPKERASLATVYRALNQLTSAGILRRHVFALGHPVYEIETGEEHHHLVCVTCLRVDAYQDELLKETVDERRRKVASTSGYAIARHELTLYGQCPRCRTPAKKPGRATVGL
jgi:Fur family ferric uptake transcriptional regulator